MTVTVVVGPRRPVGATVEVPGDKSLSHRALILSAMATGVSRLARLAPGRDVAATIRALEMLGVRISEDGILTSPGVSGWSAPGSDVDAENSATTVRLLAGALAGGKLEAVLTGDSSVRRRPMRVLVEALAELGADVSAGSHGLPPIRVRGRRLRGAHIELPIPSAQVRTAAALAGLQATGETTIRSPAGFRDHTERWLHALGLGAPLGDEGFRVLPGSVPPLDVVIPRDPSSAAFMWTAAVLSGGRVTTPGVSMNPGRVGILEVLSKMGVAVTVQPTGEILGDPVGDVTVVGPASRATEVTGDLSWRTIDELPLVALVAAVTPGDTVVADAGTLRHKESDRIEGVVAMVRALGGTAEETPDGFIVTGGSLKPGRVDSRQDHRLAMAAAVAAAAAGRVEIHGMEVMAVSWPGFMNALDDAWS